MINVGDDVICIMGQGPAPLGPCDMPRVGQSYTITGIYQMR
jgi:hypothetical protein